VMRHLGPGFALCSPRAARACCKKNSISIQKTQDHMAHTVHPLRAITLLAVSRRPRIAASAVHTPPRMEVQCACLYIPHPAQATNQATDKEAPLRLRLRHPLHPPPAGVPSPLSSEPSLPAPTPSPETTRGPLTAPRRRGGTTVRTSLW
jgi:hypothetical protein